MIGTPLTPEERQIVIRHLAEKLAVDELKKICVNVYERLVEDYIKILKDQSENVVGADENDE